MNLRVRHLPTSLEFYTVRLGMFVRGSSTREAFLAWAPSGEDFLGLFQSERRGLHHLEVRAFARTADEALTGLESLALVPLIRRAGSTSADDGRLRARLPAASEVFVPLIETPLVAELSDPDGHVLEVVYLPDDSTIAESPGLMAVELAVEDPRASASFYAQVGFALRNGSAYAASGQRVGFMPANAGALLRLEAHTHLGIPPRELEAHDPDGYKWLLSSQ